MKLLEDLRAYLGVTSRLLEDWGCIYVQHLLRTNLECVKFLETLGLKKRNLRVFGKGYSSSPSVYAEYQGEGYQIVDRSENYLFEEPFDNAIVSAIAVGIAELVSSGCKQLLIVDEGGIASRALCRTGVNSIRIVLTELTARGAAHYSLVSDRCPIVDVARSRLKKVIEARYIAESMLHCLDAELELRGLPPLNAMQVGVVGMGSIGSELAAQVQEREVEVLGFDIRPDRTNIGEVSELLSVSDIILSSTGGGVLQLLDLAVADRAKILVNCGSSDVEFNLWETASALRNLAHKLVKFDFAVPAWSAPLLIGIDAREIVVLRGGFPINFDGSPDPIPRERIQLTRAVLMAGALQAVTIQDAGVHGLDFGVQEMLEKSYALSEGHRQ